MPSDGRKRNCVPSYCFTITNQRNQKPEQALTKDWEVVTNEGGTRQQGCKKKEKESRKRKRICIFVLEIESCFEARQKRDLYLKQ